MVLFRRLMPTTEPHGAFSKGPPQMSAVVCVSPVMQMGDTPFQFKPDRIPSGRIFLIFNEEDDDFYEVRRSVERFKVFAAGRDVPVTHPTCPGGNHNWMTVDSYGEASFKPDPDAAALIREEIRFLKKRL